MKIKHAIWPLLLMIALLFQQCNKEKNAPENPFDQLNNPIISNPTDSVSPASLVGIHRNILSLKCAVPGCHDGNFEPDFRTIQSSYQTMVYVPISKNNLAETFQFRVVPFEKEQSVLFERITNCCFVNENDRMPQDNIGTALPDEDIANVGAWISNGARDLNGNVMTKPDQEPAIQYMIALSSNLQTSISDENNRVDNLAYNPFIVANGTAQFYVFVPVEDDFTPINQLQNARLFFSPNMDNFAGAIYVNGTYLNIPSENVKGFLFNIDPAPLQSNVQMYMRFFIKDPALNVTSEFPKNSSNIIYKGFWSLIKY